MGWALSAHAALWFLPPVTVIAAWVVWSDLARMKIPNAAVLSLVAVYAVIGPLVLPFDVWAWRWLHLVVVLVIGFVLNVAGGLGAGDAKFAAAMAPFIAAGDAMRFIYLFSAVLLIAFAVHRLARAVPALRARAPHWKSWERRDFPMGFALAPSLVFYLLLVAFSG